jgi:hypothetical protein
LSEGSSTEEGTGRQKEKKREQYLVCTEGPVLVQQVHQGEWHGEAAEQDPRHGHVHDEDVSRGPHHLQVQ